MARTKTSFKKGEGGRKPGSQNKITMQLRETITLFLDENFERIRSDFEELSARDRLKFYCDLLQYGLPRLQAVQLETDFERLPDDQLDEIVNRLLNGKPE